MKKFMLTFLLLVQSIPSFALGRDISYESFASDFFPAIETAAVCGNWHVDGQQGEFRVFSASIYGGTMLFVDMVRFDDTTNLNVLQRGFTVPELNNDHAEIEFSNAKCVASGENRITIVATAESGHELDLKYRFCVHVNGATGEVSYSDSRQPFIPSGQKKQAVRDCTLAEKTILNAQKNRGKVKPAIPSHDQ